MACFTIGASGRFALPAALFLMALGPMSSPRLHAQDRPEPILAALRAATDQEGLRFGLLLQAVVDPSIDSADPDPASVQVAAMRLLLSGRLDGGFEYFFQTNFAASPSILDARFGWSPSPALALSAGRFKSPFSRELLTFAGSIDFVNRARVVSQLAPNRQFGVQAGGQIHRSVHWSLGAFTGPGEPVHEDLVGVARLEYSLASATPSSIKASIAASAAAGRDGAVGTALGRMFTGEGVLFGADARLEAGRLLIAAEVITAEWEPTGASRSDGAGAYLTTGWMMTRRTQVLARWDRYRAPGSEVDDAMVIGLNIWPTSASEIQVNWVAPVAGGSDPHKLLVNLQIGF